MATSVANSRKALQDTELARLAIAGDGLAFAELYDRHEQRVYGFCMRMLHGPHDAVEATQETFVRMLARLPAMEGRELNFVAYTLTTARNVCYDMIRARRTVEPVAEQLEPRGTEPDDVDRDPERFALLDAAREEVRAANATLPARQREVLALREVELLSYDEIGELMGLNRNAVAQLISRARIGLREQLRGGALASVGTRTPDCAHALAQLAAVQDRQDHGPGGLDWMHTHLSGCEHCRLGRAAMEEAGVSYRALGLLVPLAWLRHATIARAAEFVGADWSHLAGLSGPATSSAGTSPPGAAETAAPGRPGTVDLGDPQTPAGGAHGKSSTTGSAAPAGLLAHAWQDATQPGVRRRLLVGALLMLALCVGIVFLAASDIAQDGRKSSSSAQDTDSQTTVTAPTPHHELGASVAPPKEHGPRLQRPIARTPAIGDGAVATLSPPAVRVRTVRRDRRHRPSKPSPRRPVSVSTPSQPAQPVATTAPAPPPSTTPAPAQSTPTSSAPAGGSTDTTSSPGETPSGNSPTEPPGGSTGPGPGLIP